MKKLEILLFEEHLSLLKAVADARRDGEDWEYDDWADTIDELLDTLSKIAFDDEYYALYRKFNEGLGE